MKKSKRFLKSISIILLLLVVLLPQLSALTTSETEQLNGIYNELTLSYQNQTELLASNKLQIQNLQSKLSSQEIVYQNLDQNLKIQSELAESLRLSTQNLSTNQKKLTESYQILESSLTTIQSENKLLKTQLYGGLGIVAIILVISFLT